MSTEIFDPQYQRRKLKHPATIFEIEDKTKLNFENNASYDCNILESRPHTDLTLCECGYEKCDPYHFWGYGCKAVFVLHWILNGKGTLIINHQVFHPKAGQIFLLQPSDMVYYVSDPAEPWEYRWISFGGSRAQGIINETRFADKALLDIKNLPALETLFENLKAHADNELVSTGYLFLMLAQLQMDYAPEKDRVVLDVRVIEFNKILSYLRQNFGKSNLINDIADEFGYNRSHLYKLFVKYTGVSPKQYISSLRIHLACEYIKSNVFTFENISKNLGYNDYTSFYRNFKTITGCSPIEYLEKHV